MISISSTLWFGSFQNLQSLLDKKDTLSVLSDKVNITMSKAE